MTKEADVKATRSELKAGIELSAGRSHVIEIIEYTLHIRIDIDADDECPSDDKFTLRGGPDPETVEYEQERTAQDDLIEGDDYIDIIFTDLIPGLTYSLEVKPGEDEDPYFLFEDLDYQGMDALDD